MDELALHPTVKPVQMIADAIKDVLRARRYRPRPLRRLRLDPDRRPQDRPAGYLCELDPIYCDRIIRRWEAYAKDDAEQIACGLNDAAPERAAA